MRWEKATYTEAILPEHKENPLIEALPPKLPIKDIMEKFSNYPELDSEIRGEPDPLIREEYLSRIGELRQPLNIYFDCFRAIERAIKTGYSSKNPFSPTTMQFLHYPVDETPEIAPKTGFFVPKGDGLTLVGDSGLGKTCMLEQVLNYFPHVIEHDTYKNKKVPCRYQVVWLKVDCPTKSSVRELCEEILVCLDNAMHQASPTIPAATIPKLLVQIEQRIKSSFLGILVIDEMQNLEFTRTGGENNLLKFLHKLVNKLGVPLFFCANPPFDDSLAQNLRNARRAESGGYFNMLPLERNEDGWTDFVEELWELQWTNIATPLSDELNSELHSLSLGNLDIACRIYEESQRLIIGTDDERITVSVLRDAYAIACGLSSKTKEVQARREVVTRPRRNKSPQPEKKSKSNVLDKPKIISDFNRPQHEEFRERLREIHLADDLPERIDDPDKIRRADKENNLIKYLQDENILCDDPLLQIT